MKVAIMQPYFFPYIGYFQLINAVDKFVVYDNIQYTKKGWINRNRILQNGKDTYITISITKDSDYLNVVDREVSPNFDKTKLLNQISGAYKKAPYFENVYPIIKDIIDNQENNLFRYILFSIQEVCKYLGIKDKLVVSSEVNIDHTLTKEDKVLALCKALDADTYINPIGGLELYSKDMFAKEDINLHFLKTNSGEYTQFKNDFIPFLSIIDVMMFNSQEDVCKMLNNFELI